MDEKIYLLRTCDARNRGYNDFQWPESGVVEAPDWDPRPVCGGGLHGLLSGEGDHSLLNWSEDARWLVVEALASECVNLQGKVKVRRGVVLFCGDRAGATSLMLNLCPGRSVVGATSTAGDAGTATAGERGTATAGERGTATAGYAGTATAGYAGTATAGERGTATAGDAGTATAGVRGTATAGNHGTATAGYAGTATAGKEGILSMRWWDGARYRLATFYVGEDGVEADVPYKCEGGRPVRADGK